MGEANKYADFAYQNNLVAIGWNEIEKNLGNYKNLSKKEFFKEFDPCVSKAYENRSKNTHSAIIGQLFRFLSLIEVGDVVLVPKTQEGKIYVGIIDSEYLYQEEVSNEFNYKHRRKVKWVKIVDISEISQNLRNSLGAMMTVFSISSHAQEIESLLAENGIRKDDIENLEDFGLESHLEDFVIKNWDKLSLNKEYSILHEDNEIIGQQYVTPIGRVDILAKSKNQKEWLVIELKKGKSSDHVVGQILRYIAWIRENEAAPNEKVKGLIIAREQDEKLKYSLKATENVEFMTYSVNFKLNKNI